jgi:hypothetical protein
MANSQFLQDGRRRAIKGAAEKIEELRTRITAEVEAEYSEELAEAGVLRRLWLRRIIAQEIEVRLAREIDNFAPHDGLYLQNNPGHHEKGKPT